MIVLTLLSGVALFLYGMSLMGDGLKRVAGNQLEHMAQEQLDTAEQQLNNGKQELETQKADLKVSSAIDNPSSYYTASSLNNRAADLTALLDAMSQGIQTIKAASEAIDSGTKFLEQAKAVANQALETSENIIAKVSTADELLAAVNSGASGLILIDGEINIDGSQIILHSIVCFSVSENALKLCS